MSNLVELMGWHDWNICLYLFIVVLWSIFSLKEKNGFHYIDIIDLETSCHLLCAYHYKIFSDSPEFDSEQKEEEG